MVSLALKNNAPSSASVAEDKTDLMMEQCVWIDPLKGGGLESGLGFLVGAELRKKILPVKDQALVSDK
jgi:hypothetical protein